MTQLQEERSAGGEVALRRRPRGRLARWARGRLRGMFAYDTRRWRGAIAALWLLDSAASLFCALGMPTGFGAAFDAALFLSANTIGFALASWLVAAIVALIGLKLPRFALGSALYSGVLAFNVLYYTDFGLVGSIVYAALFAAGAAAIGVLFEAAFRSRRTAIAAVAAAVVAAGSVAWAARPSDAGDWHPAAQGEVNALAAGLQDPSVPGPYLVDAFAYGSGTDKRRPEFGKDAALTSATVDASRYIDSWPWLREKFWGFDETALPVNGRVWLPEGGGAHPLVLMVHGNHMMEDYSDEGYAYLGELLASRGIVAVSVDENFLNYSAWSGIPKQDMKLRAWMLLQHIGQLQRYNEDSSSPLYGRIDFGQVALLGHSRGGQAVAMAADRGQWFSETEGLPVSDSYTVKAVVAIAPTDTVVDGKQARLHNVSYLTLQGAKDADLVNFYGDRQYDRTSLDDDAGAIKASLYVAGANHSQFNTEWGEFDNSFPGRLFIRPQDKLAPGEQRQIAKLYVSAFLETAFGKGQDYRPLFKDYEVGASLLPATDYYSQYQDGEFRLLAGFDGDDRAAPGDGVTATATGMSEWSHAEALNRQEQGKGDKGVLLAWDEAGAYTVSVDDDYGFELDDDTKLMFSFADLSDEPLPDEVITVRVKDRDGNEASLPLADFARLAAAPETSFVWLPGMEDEISDGKFKNATEYVFQTVEIPLSAFEDADPDFTPSEWRELTLSFADGPGSVMLDDLGIER